MSEQKQITQSWVEESWEILVTCLRPLINQEMDIRGARGLLTEAATVLDSLPMSTSEFALATRRLNNARRYMEFNERGAARYELRLLIGGLTPKPNGRPLNRRIRERVA